MTVRKFFYNKIWLLFFLFFLQGNLCALETTELKNANVDIDNSQKNPVEKRQSKETALPSNFFALQLYKPTYLLPYYFTGSPDNTVYESIDRTVKHDEVKYQISFKVPLWKNIFHRPSTLYLGYTQLAYWQLYTHDPFFRETDYEPELFLANAVNLHLIKNWKLNTINFGLVHQSNGVGGTMERSWNRVYLELMTSYEGLFLGVKPWYVFHDSSIADHNPDIGYYLGYYNLLGGYKFYKQVFTLETRNITTRSRKTATLTWSFPLTDYIKGYVQVFSGYGQSLIEYNHHTNSAGVGITLNDWV